MPFEFILTEVRGAVALVTMHRPQARNALNNQLLHELMDAMESYDLDASIGSLVITGSENAFAAGADIKEMADQDAASMLKSGFIATFGRMNGIQKPIIAAVSGWALGGGCELALASDMIVASETAKFGQPEVTIGVIPGAGGSQRLPRAVGKSIAMEMILNGRTLSAQEALQFGMVNRVVPVDRYLEEAMGLAREIAARAPLAVRSGRRLINQSYDQSLDEGLQSERDEFHSLFASADREEGMRAFAEKRDPHWKRR